MDQYALSSTIQHVDTTAICGPAQRSDGADACGQCRSRRGIRTEHGGHPAPGERIHRLPQGPRRRLARCAAPAPPAGWRAVSESRREGACRRDRVRRCHSQRGERHLAPGTTPCGAVSVEGATSKGRPLPPARPWGKWRRLPRAAVPRTAVTIESRMRWAASGLLALAYKNGINQDSSTVSGWSGALDRYFVRYFVCYVD